MTVSDLFTNISMRVLRLNGDCTLCLALCLSVVCMPPRVYTQHYVSMLCCARQISFHWASVVCVSAFCTVSVTATANMRTFVHLHSTVLYSCSECSIWMLTTTLNLNAHSGIKIGQTNGHISANQCNLRSLLKHIVCLQFLRQHSEFSHAALLTGNFPREQK